MHAILQNTYLLYLFICRILTFKNLPKCIQYLADVISKMPKVSAPNPKILQNDNHLKLK